MSGSVLVVGGGVAGRAVARVLAGHGLGCTVLEQRTTSGPGMGVNLPGNAVRALAELGVTADELASGVPVRRREYRNGRGRLLFAVDDEQFWHGVALPVCLRHGDLLAALAFPATATLENGRAVAARPTASGVEVDLEQDGVFTTRRYDAVVGADGIHSAVRGAITNDGLRPSSMTRSCWRFVADDPGIDCWTAWSGPDVTVLLIPVAEGRVYGYVARTRGGDTASDPAWLARATTNFPKLVRMTVAAAVAAGGALHTRVDEVRLERWHRARLVLIGDAAHATGPVWAQGVAMALEDALVLGELLAMTRVESWAGVGAEFERLRRPRVDHVQSATDKMSRLAALPGVLRDVIAPVAGPRNYRATYGPLRTALMP